MLHPLLCLWAGEAPHTAGTRKPTHIAVIRKCASPRTSLYGRPLWVPWAGQGTARGRAQGTAPTFET